MSDLTSNRLSRAEPIEQEIAHPFAVGDMVTHYMGGGTWRVIDINREGDQIHVECMQPNEASEFPPWCKVGDQEWNLSRRYKLLMVTE